MGTVFTQEATEALRKHIKDICDPMVKQIVDEQLMPLHERQATMDELIEKARLRLAPFIADGRVVACQLSHKGEALVRVSDGVLMTSRDGVHFEEVARLQVDSPSETTLRFLPDETLVAIATDRPYGPERFTVCRNSPCAGS